MAGEFLGAVPWTVMDGWAWIVILLLVTAAAVETRSDGLARQVAAGGWLAFAGFWLPMVPHFYFYEASVIKAVLSLVAVPACAYGAYLLWTGRDLLLLSRAIAFMGVIYLPFITIDAAHAALVEVVARHVDFSLALLGHHPELVYTDQGLSTGEVRNALLFEGTAEHAPGGPYRINVILACTGIGAISIFGGLVSAVDAPLHRKLATLAVIVPIIWALNLVRVGFIALAHGYQWFHDVAPNLVMVLFATDNPARVSFLISDKILAQSLSVLALVGLTFLAVRLLPQLVEPLEDALLLLTGDEVDLGEAMGVDDRL